MMRRLVVLTLTAVLTGPAAAIAHDGPHRKIGTVTMVEADHVMLRTTDGKDVRIAVNARTKIVRGKTPARISDLKEGTRIVATVKSEKAPFTASRIAVGVATEPAPKK